MKKVMGIGEWVSGFRYRVSGFARWSRMALWLIMALGFGNPSFGIELNYKFKKGQLIQYQYDAVSDGRNLRKKDHFVYEFKVNSLSDTGAYMTMVLKQHTFYLIDNPGSETAIYNQQSFPETNNSEANPLWYEDIDKPIAFHLASDGRLSQFHGITELFNGIISNLQTKKSIGNKPYINFNWLKLRYSEDYYKMLIGCFFPPQPRSRREQSLVSRFSYANETIRFCHYWGGSFPDSSTRDIQFQKQVIFYVNEKLNRNSDDIKNFKMLDKGPGTATWSPALNVFSKLTFNNINMPLLLMSWINGGLTPTHETNSYYPETCQSSIELSDDSGHGTVNLTLKTLPVDSMQMDMFSPSGLIDPYRWTSTFSKAQRDTAQVIYSIVLAEDDLFNLNLDKMNDRPLQEGLFIDKFWFYAQPGDSIDIIIDMEHPDTIRFRGSHVLENQFLQRFFRYKFAGRIMRSFYGNSWILDGLRSDLKLLEKSRLEFDPKFVERLEFELEYRIRQYELMVMTEDSKGKEPTNLKSVLRNNRQYLGQLKHRESAAYKSFLFEFVRLCQWNAGIMDSWNNQADYRSAEIFLQGWDRYWLLGKLAFDGLKSRRGPGYDAYYLSFINEYADTDFGKELQTLYKPIRLTDDPDLPVKLDIAQFSGHPVLVSFDYENTRDFYTRLYKKIYKSGRSDFRIVQYIPKEDFDKVLHELYAFADFAWLNETKLQINNEIFPRIMNDSVETLIQNWHSMALLFDRDGKFVTFLKGNLISELTIKNILSWPALEPPIVKKINLTIFWYSLAGAFLLSLLIILTIRIRSKRKEARMNLNRKIAQLEVDAVRSRMNPHFLFNALSSIQNLINRGQTEAANLYLARFGDLVRTILLQSSKPAIGLNEEIDVIRNYLQLEQLGLPFEFEIIVDPNLDTVNTEVPPLLIQPHVENAVIHGIGGLGDKGRIRIVFRAENGTLVCEVSDNGPGYHPEAKSGSKRLGQGWKLTRERISLMKAASGEELSVEVVNHPPESEDSGELPGTTVIFRLPMQKSEP